jgi:hypothetical protein
MGGRRKGDLSPARLDREWPHQVMLPGSRVVGRTQGEEIEAFCKARSAGPLHHAVVISDVWHVVYCFSQPEDVEAFRERFGGEPFDPAKRGRGRHWLHYYPDGRERK